MVPFPQQTATRALWTDATVPANGMRSICSSNLTKFFVIGHKSVHRFHGQAQALSFLIKASEVVTAIHGCIWTVHVPIVLAVITASYCVLQN